MQVIISLFWNAQERRLRALWRLILQMVVWVIFTFIALLIIGIAVVAVVLVSSGLSDNRLALDQVNQLLSRDTLGTVVTEMAMLIGILGSTWLIGRFIDRRKFADFGFHLRPGWWLDLGFGMALGAVLMGLIFATEQAAGWVTITGTFDPGASGQPFMTAFLVQVALYIAVGITEEQFSRGYQLKNLAEGLRLGRLSSRTATVVSLVITSAVFGLMHLGNPSASAVSTFNIFLAGLLLGLGVLLTGDLAISIGLHITWNLFQGNVFGFPVSGTGAGAPSVIAIHQGGPELWTGGAFGPEAGLVGILAMLVGAGLIVGWARLRYGRVAIDERVGEPPARPVVAAAEDVVEAGAAGG